MNKVAAYMTQDKNNLVVHGYANALKKLGWKVYICSPITKMEVSQLILNYGVRLIFACSKHYFRQLPIDHINKYEVGVIFNVLPLKDTRANYCGDCADDYEIDVLRNIEKLVAHTPFIESSWSTYFLRWIEEQILLTHLPYASNTLMALPDNFVTKAHVAFTSNTTTNKWDLELVKRLNILRKVYCVGNYGNSIICSNLHTTEQRSMSAYVNPYFFYIPALGGFQITDILIGKQYYDVDIADNFTTLINLIDLYLSNPSLRFNRMLNCLKTLLTQHSYFNRLNTIFNKLNMIEEANAALEYGNRIGIKRSWEIEARLTAQMEGKAYESDGKALARV